MLLYIIGYFVLVFIMVGILQLQINKKGKNDEK